MKDLSVATVQKPRKLQQKQNKHISRYDVNLPFHFPEDRRTACEEVVPSPRRFGALLQLQIDVTHLAVTWDGNVRPKAFVVDDYYYE